MYLTPKHVVLDVKGHTCHEHDVLGTGVCQQSRPKKSWKNKILAISQADDCKMYYSVEFISDLDKDSPVHFRTSH